VLVDASPALGSTISASVPPTIRLRFTMVCREDGVTFLAARLNSAAGAPCVALYTGGNGVDARAGKASLIEVSGTVYAGGNGDGGAACPLPVDLTSVEVTSQPAPIGGFGVVLPFYYDTCFVSQTLPVSYRLVP
jgi:hypothetical protein